jgi:hypothetical protein
VVRLKSDHYEGGDHDRTRGRRSNVGITIDRQGWRSNCVRETMMVEDRARSALLEVESPVAWTFPAGLIMISAAFIGLAVFVFYPRTLPPACEMQLRTLLTFVLPAGLGGVLMPLAIASLSPALRAVAAVVLGAGATAIAWTAVASLFPSFC